MQQHCSNATALSAYCNISDSELSTQSTRHYACKQNAFINHIHTLCVMLFRVGFCTFGSVSVLFTVSHLSTFLPWKLDLICKIQSLNHFKPKQQICLSYHQMTTTFTPFLRILLHCCTDDRVNFYQKC